MKINLKLERDVLTLLLDGERTFEEQKEDIKKYLFGMKSFLNKSDVKFSYEGAELSFDEENELCDIADTAFGMNVNFIYKVAPPENIMRHIMANGERLSLKVERTVRAGEHIKSNGDVVVLGDVNPTAQIVAYGDIYVIGNLRGLAHAGFGGNENAIVYAMKMNPVMLKIADKIGFNPEMSRKNENGIAKIEDGEIRIKMI